MLSDKWLRDGFKKKDIIAVVPNLVYCKIWVDEADNPVGIGIDFEHATDIHYEFQYADWHNYLRKKFGRCDESEHYTLLGNYLKKHGWHGFEQTLEKYRIEYDKIHFD